MNKYNKTPADSGFRENFHEYSPPKKNFNLLKNTFPSLGK